MLFDYRLETATNAIQLQYIPKPCKFSFALKWPIAWRHIHTATTNNKIWTVERTIITFFLHRDALFQLKWLHHIFDISIEVFEMWPPWPSAITATIILSICSSQCSQLVKYHPKLKHNRRIYYWHLDI